MQLISLNIIGNLFDIVGKPVYSPFKWCHTCKELGCFWVAQLNNLTNRQAVYSALAIDSFFEFLVPPGTIQTPD